MNDKLCLEHGLSIVENPKPSRGHYGTWLGEEKQPSYQEQLRRIIDTVLEERPKDFSDFLEKLKDYGAEVNALTQSLVDALINKIYVFKDDRIEIDYAVRDLFIETPVGGTLSSDSEG